MVSEFKPGDRVHFIDHPLAIGTLLFPDPDVKQRWFVRLDRAGEELSMRTVDLAHHTPTKPRPGRHPNSLANLAKGSQRRKNCRTKKLRLTATACEWLERQPDQGRAVERLIMEAMEREELSLCHKT